MLEDGEDLSELSGIGEDLAGKIETIVETGTHPTLEELKDEVPESLQELLRVSGLGPRGVQTIYEELGVTDLDGLLKAAKQGSLSQLSGFGEKTQAKILEEVESIASEEERTLLAEAADIASEVVEHLRSHRGVKKACAAGSLRRRRETVGDLDILVSCREDADVVDHFLEFEDIDEVVARGDTKTTVILRSGLQVDLRVVPHAAYGAALVYFTGSKQHNIGLRRRGQERNLKVNEYGVHSGREKVAGKTEEEVYEALDLPWIAPELRENRGEIEAAEEGGLPDLVELDDIRGDLHAHTSRTDGHQTIREMAEAARDLGYGYLAITEHSRRVTVAGGLDADELAAHADDIEEADGDIEGIRILSGVEVDILEDGSLDLPDDVLQRLDVVVASVHYRFGLPRGRQTERVLRALDNPHLHILGHPTGRMLGQRDPYEIDLERIMEAAAERGCFLELNAYPERLDLTDVACMRAREKGAKVVISTDAHRTSHLEYMRFGVGQARRGWLSASDVVNTRPVDELLEMMERG
jgi:DNA polymerase (family 10)